MKRNENIAPLSREHHTGLLCSWKIRQGIKKNILPERINAYLHYFWNDHLRFHFEKEEKLVFNVVNDEFCRTAVNEHLILATLISDIEREPVFSKLSSFADLLEKHIRYEERVLFPHLENTLDLTQLAMIGKGLAALHSQPVADNYADEFWK